MSAFEWCASHPLVTALALAWLLLQFPLAVLVGRMIRTADDEMARHERFVSAKVWQR